MKKEEIQKIVLLLIIAFGIGYSYYTYLFVPEWSIIQTSTARLNEREAYYQRLMAYAANVSEIEKEMKLLDIQQRQFLNQTSSDLDKPGILVYLYNLAKQYNVVPDKVVFGQPQDKGTYRELPFTFTLSGQVDVVLSLIKHLQYSGNQRFAIQSTKLTDQQGLLQVELKMTIYIPVLSSKGETLRPKPPYMVYPFGTQSNAQLFNE